jgi:hypothetical protein
LLPHKGAAEGKTLWLNQARTWGQVDGHTLPTVSDVTWADDGKPWLTLTVEEVAYNVGVDTSLGAKGP